MAPIDHSIPYDRAKHLCKIFGLREFPTHSPYAKPMGFDFPANVSELALTQAACLAAAKLFKPQPQWFIGDVLRWTQAYRPEFFDWLRVRFRLAGIADRTQHNYKSMAIAYALAERIEGVDWRIYDRCRTEPADVRRMKLLEAVAQKSSAAARAQQKMLATVARRLHREAVGRDAKTKERVIRDLLRMMEQAEKIRKDC